jgi:hypothetical protein
MLISTIHRSPQHLLSPFQPNVSWQQILTLEILQPNALRSSCRSHPCRTQLNCQFDYSVISSRFPLQSSTNCCPSSLLYNHVARTAYTTPRCMRDRCRGNVFTEQLCRHGFNINAHLTIATCNGYTRYNMDVPWGQSCNSLP